MTQSLITISFFFRCQHIRHLSNTASDDTQFCRPSWSVSWMHLVIHCILITPPSCFLWHRLRLPPLSSTFDFEVLLTTCAHNVVKDNDSSEAKIAIDFAQPGSLAYHLKQHNRISFSSSTTPSLYSCSFSLLMCHKLYTIFPNRFVEKSFQAASYQHIGLGNMVEWHLMVRMTSFCKLLCCFNNYYCCWHEEILAEQLQLPLLLLSLLL